jgi:hypothetical protein
MKEELQKRLRAIQEGAITEGAGSTDDDGDIDFNLDDMDDEFLAEVNLAILESEIGSERMAQFITEAAGDLVRDQLLTEDVVGKSYIVLSPQARRQKAINLLKLRMAREANDPRYKKLIIARKLVKSLLIQIRKDGRYNKAETIIRKQHFKIVSNPAAASAMKRAQQLKLQ